MKQKLLALILCFSFLFSNLSCIQGYALVPNDTATSDENDLISSAMSLVPHLEELESSLGVECDIIILENTPNIQKVKFIEGNKVDIVTYNVLDDEYFINDDPVIYEEVLVENTNLSNNEASTYALTDAVTEFKGGIHFEKYLYQYTVTSLTAILDAVADVTGNVALQFASALITLCTSMGYMYSKACYLHQYRRTDSSYMFYTRYWDMYWTNVYTPANLCDSYNQTYYYSK